jgi:hypothetical protein
MRNSNSLIKKPQTLQNTNKIDDLDDKSIIKIRQIAQKPMEIMGSKLANI